jgi:site-specific recombinase XerC
MRGWCPVGIATSIMAPRVFQHETLPSGPTWDIVQEILDATAGDQPITIRDHAILMLFAVYGVRSKDLAATQAYLTMTPDLLQEASLRFERYTIQEGSND